MPLGNPTGGFSLAPEFQSSALPWVTSSVASTTPLEIDFNYITRFISIINTDASNSIELGFTLNGMKASNSNFVTVPKGVALTLEWRVAKVWIASNTSTAAYTLAVGLTTIPAGQMPILSGSGPDGSNWAGVG
jgi:hypothetical protein